MKKRLGTNSFSGLNVGTAPHLIAPSDLTLSENGWTDKVGTWTTAPGPTRKYTGYSDITAFVAARILGADHLVWYDNGDTKIYDNGTAIDTLDLGSVAKAYAANDGVLFYGNSSDTRNYIYDGYDVREIGTWQAPDTDDAPVARVETANTETMSAATQADPCVITVSALPYSNGTTISVWIENVVGMTELNDRLWEGTVVSSTTISLNVDSSGFTAYSSGGSVYTRACGLTGDYRFYMTTTIRLASGETLESTPVGFAFDRDKSLGSESDVFTLTPTDEWSSVFGARWNDGADDYYYHGGTIGTDFYPGLRLYRTKADGSDFYLVDSWEYGTDATLSGGVFLWANSAQRVYSEARDLDLGAVYLPSFTDRTNPETAALITTAGQRMFFVPYSATNELHWTELDGIEYSNPLSYVKIPDVITAIYGYRDRVVVWSADRMWVFDLTGGIPDLKEIITPVGTTYPDAIARTDMGLLFLRLDGLWLFDGIKVQCVSRRAFSSITAPKSVCAAADTIYLSGESDSYVIRIRDDGWHWHEGNQQYIFADDTSGVIYGASLYNIDELFTGDSRGGKMRTKLWTTDSEEWVGTKILVEVEDNSGFDLTVSGGRSSDTLSHYESQEPGTTTRRLVEVSIPRLPNNNFYVTLETSGFLAVHGMYPEVTR